MSFERRSGIDRRSAKEDRRKRNIGPPAATSEAKEKFLLSEKAARVQVFWAADLEAFFPPETVVDVLCISNNTLTNWRSQGHGPRFVKRVAHSKLVYYKKVDVLEWLNEFSANRL